MSTASNSTFKPHRRILKQGLRWGAMAATTIAFVGLMAAGITGLHRMANATAPVTPSAPVPVRAEAISAVSGYRIQEHFVGRLEPARRTRLAFEQSGIVTEILVDEGNTVKAGDRIARLDTAKLDAERSMLTARRRQLEAQLGLGELTLKRKKRLMASGHETVERHDQARFAVAGLKAAIENIDASLKSIDVDIAKSVLLAPFAGRVGERMIDEGAVVSPNMAVVDLLEADRRQVRIGLSVEASAKLMHERTYMLTGNGRTYSARLVAIRPDLSSSTRTVTAVFDVRMAAGLPFGEVMELALDRFVTEQGFWVPLTALHEGVKGLWTVYTLKSSDNASTVQRQVVEVLHTERAKAFVRGTLRDGAMLVLDGTNRIVPGQQVALASSKR